MELIKEKVELDDIMIGGKLEILCWGVLGHVVWKITRGNMFYLEFE